MWNPPPWAFWPGAWPPPRPWAATCRRRPARPPPALWSITGGAEARSFQPMNVNFGLFPPVEARGGRRGRKDRYPAYTERAKADFAAWLAAR